MAGTPEAKWRQQQALSKRKLKQTAVPRIEWKDAYEGHQLHADGAIVADGISVELGWINGTGGVSWTK
jgi:hypothetical protein